MVGQDLVSYIQDNLAKGFSIHEIKQGLLAQGISDSEINESLRIIRGSPKSNNFSPKKLEFQKTISHRGLKIFLGILVIFLFIFLFLFFLIKAERPLKSEVTVSEYALLGGVSLELVEGSTVDIEFDLNNYLFSIEEVNEDKIVISGDISSEIALGDTKYFDLNEDFVNDFFIEVKSLKKHESSIYIKLIDNFECQEDWICSQWSSCINGAKKRVCLDLQDCGTNYSRPELEGTCFDKISNTTNLTKIPKKVNCTSFVIPDCEDSYPNNVSDIQKILGNGETLTFPNYDEDCSLVCFGNNLLGSCEIANVTLRDGFGSEELFSSQGVENESCKLRYEVIEENPDEPGSQGVYLECSIPLDLIYNMSCVDEACLEEGMPGQTTMGVLTSMVLDSLLNPETNCNGTMIDYLLNS